MGVILNLHVVRQFRQNCVYVRCIPQGLVVKNSKYQPLPTSHNPHIITPMKLISWNVNGLRACLGKGFLESMQGLDADIICLQETKMQQGQAEVALKDYAEFWNSAVKKGYSGTAIFTRHKPLNASSGIGDTKHDQEGRDRKSVV